MLESKELQKIIKLKSKIDKIFGITIKKHKN